MKWRTPSAAAAVLVASWITDCAGSRAAAAPTSVAAIAAAVAAAPTSAAAASAAAAPISAAAAPLSAAAASAAAAPLSAAAAAAAVAAAAKSQPLLQLPHVVFVIADDLGFNDVGFHGSEIETPFLDSVALGNHSVHLANYYGQSICTPARSSIMTGRYASHTGLQHSYWMQGQAGGLPLGFSTIGDHFKALNYSTHFVGKWHLGFESWAYTPIERGFDSYYGYLGGGEDYFTHMSGGFVDFTADRDAVLNASGAYSTELFTNRSIDRILAHAAENEGSDPFFLLLAMQAIHSPLEAPAEWVSKYDWITNKDRRTLAGMTSCLDYQLSRVASTLQDVGMWNNTIFVFTADNGSFCLADSGYFCSACCTCCCCSFIFLGTVWVWETCRGGHVFQCLAG